MCLGVPMRVIEVNQGGTAMVESFGVRRLVQTRLVGDVNTGEYLMIHAGYAIEKINQDEAWERLRLWEDLLANELARADEA